jgi:hypothetical protein
MEGMKVQMWKVFHHHFIFPNNQLPWICQLSRKSKLWKCFILLCFGCSNFHLKVTICMLKSERSWTMGVNRSNYRRKKIFTKLNNTWYVGYGSCLNFSMVPWITLAKQINVISIWTNELICSFYLTLQPFTIWNMSSSIWLSLEMSINMLECIILTSFEALKDISKWGGVPKWWWTFHDWHRFTMLHNIIWIFLV